MTAPVRTLMIENEMAKLENAPIVRASSCAYPRRWSVRRSSSWVKLGAASAAGSMQQPPRRVYVSGASNDVERSVGPGHGSAFFDRIDGINGIECVLRQSCSSRQRIPTAMWSARVAEQRAAGRRHDHHQPGW